MSDPSINTLLEQISKNFGGSFLDTVVRKQIDILQEIAKNTAQGSGSGGSPPKTMEELRTTYLASDHPAGTVVITDTIPYRPAYSDGIGNWRLYDGSIAVPNPHAALYERGVALQGMESEGTKLLPGAAGTDYNLHPDSDFDYLKKKGFKLIRVGYLWERLQPTLNGALDETYLGYLISCIKRAYARGMAVILDCHNYGRRRALGTNGAVSLIGSAETPISAIADMYTKLASRVKGMPGLWGYDIMNEPHDMLVPQTPGTYNINRALSDIQLIPNWKFEKDTIGFSLDASYTRVTDASYNGGAPAVKLAGVDSGDGQYANFTTSNDANSGYDVLPNTTYIMSLNYKSSFTGNAPAVKINSGSAFGTTLAQASMVNATSRTRLSFAFTTGASDTKVWIRMQNLGGVGTAFFDAMNITKDATVQPYRDYCFSGKYATSSLMYQACLDAIRNAGDKESWCLVETDGYAGLHSFTSQFGSNPDIWWKDSANKTMLSFHFYFDADHGGKYQTAWTQALANAMPALVKPALDWCKAKGVKIFIGEYGVPPGTSASDKGYQAMLETFLTLLDSYNAWGIYYAAGIQFSSETNLQPTDNYTVDRPQMAILTNHLSKYAA